MFYEKANGLIPEALQASFVNLKANWGNFASFRHHFELVYNWSHNFWTTNGTVLIFCKQLTIFYI